MLRKKIISAEDQILILINICNLDLRNNDNFCSFKIYRYVDGKEHEYANPTILGFLDICFYCLFGKSVSFIHETNMLIYNGSLAGKSLYNQIMEQENSILFGNKKKTIRRLNDLGNI